MENTKKIVQGYFPDEPDERDYIFGSGQLPYPIILPDGNWRKFFIADEFQTRPGVETFGCVTFSILNAIEKLAKILFGEDWNKSERFTYIASETDPANKGNSPKKVAKSIQKIGVINETDLPFDDSVDTLEKFNSPRPLTNDLLEKAKIFLRDYVFGYDFIPLGEATDRSILREALKRSPITIAVFAWIERDGVYIRPEGMSDTHLTLLENVKDNGELEIFDSYSPIQKTLDKDFPIYTAIRIFIRKKTEEEKRIEAEIEAKIPIWQKMVNYIMEMVKLLAQKKTEPVPEPVPEPAPEKPIAELFEKIVEPVKEFSTIEKWGTPLNTRHNARVIMDTFNLSWSEKDLLCAVIQQESGFNIKAKNKNLNKETGELLSTDWGICQINDYWWIGAGKYFASVDEVLNQPEKSVKFLCEKYKAGKLNLWVAYSSGAYKKWL